MQGKSSEPPWFTSPASDPAEPDGGRLGSIWSFLGPIVSFSGQRHFVTEYWIDPFGHFTEKTKPCHHEYYVLTDAPQRGVVAKGGKGKKHDHQHGQSKTPYIVSGVLPFWAGRIFNCSLNSISHTPFRGLRVEYGIHSTPSLVRWVQRHHSVRSPGRFLGRHHRGCCLAQHNRSIPQRDLQ